MKNVSHFRAAIMIMAVAGASGFWAPTAPAGVAAEKPNVLFIAVDDLNDWIEPLGGHPQTKTPNLMKLAARSILFTNAHCAAPACNPSRAALMTGIRPSTSGVYHNPDPWRKALPDAVTLPQHFMKHGYTALGSGKIYHGSFPDPPSWDEYFPSKSKQTPGDPQPDGKPLNGIPKTSHFDWGPVDVDVAEMGDAQVADWITGRLGEEHEKPFFMACGFYRPHLPWYVPQQYFDMFPLEDIQLPTVREDDLSDVPPAGVRMAKPDGDHAKVIAHDQWKRAVQGYLASIAFMDDQLGRVLSALESGPNANNTIIVLWTDHGWHLGEKQHWRKFALWERATRTPLLVMVPENLSDAMPGGTSPKGGRCEQPVSLLDIYPTLIDLCGLSPNDALEGQSLLPQLFNPDALRDEPAITTHGFMNHSVRTQRWRYIRYEDGGEELYDHRIDEPEFVNLANHSTYADIKAQLAALLPSVNADPVPRGNKSAATERARVLLLGDSISIGYTNLVREMLTDEAKVLRPMKDDERAENCAGTTLGVTRIADWLKIDGGDFDVIHFNFGLHDLKRVDPEDRGNSNNPAHPRQAEPEAYERQLREIVAHLKQTDASLIFATTTPYPGGVKPHRDPEDASRYNDIARAIMVENNIAINDLYSLAEGHLEEWQRPVNVHFTPEGSQRLARRVVNTIRKAIDARAKD